MIVLLNGIGVLLPWNMFITIAPNVSFLAIDYIGLAISFIIQWFDQEFCYDDHCDEKLVCTGAQFLDRSTFSSIIIGKIPFSLVSFLSISAASFAAKLEEMHFTLSTKQLLFF